MESAVVTVLITTIASMITGTVAWVASRRKRDVEIKKKKSEIEEKDAQIVKLRSESSAAIMKQYQDALDDLKKRYDDRFEYLKQEYQIRHEDVQRDYDRKHTALKDQYGVTIKKLESEIDSLRKNLELWKNKYRNLKKEINRS